MQNGKSKAKGGILGNIFPPRYDFMGMLLTQAELTRDGVRALNDWLARNNLGLEPKEVAVIEQRADDTRLRMEGMLLEAFSTPFDRQDIYSLSRQMDHILNFCMSTAIEMRAFGVRPDASIIEMASILEKGTQMVLDAVRVMSRDPPRAERMIVEMRQAEHGIEKSYVSGLIVLFDSPDVVEIMKKREVYHHLKDAGRALSITIDILHRIIVELV
ncbi:MAG: DUF47 family protein [Methanomassiliicoccus sp.]|nr:DUF47 family protein [Methanomassiliicoccus sp.]